MYDAQDDWQRYMYCVAVEETLASSLMNITQAVQIKGYWGRSGHGLNEVMIISLGRRERVHAQALGIVT